MFSRLGLFIFAVIYTLVFLCFLFFFFQAEDGIRDFCLSRGLGDVYKRQGRNLPDKEFRYLRTVIVTAAVYWGLNSKLRVSANLSS